MKNKKDQSYKTQNANKLIEQNEVLSKRALPKAHFLLIWTFLFRFLFNVLIKYDTLWKYEMILYTYSIHEFKIK
jgi:hypothetical protein